MVVATACDAAGTDAGLVQTLVLVWSRGAFAHRLRAMVLERVDRRSIPRSAAVDARRRLEFGAGAT